mmetsp:Transcript_34812/g.35369  ORF Transcript_34812/g.35369 Transcript_34812/m.35369 type:complete len:137 (-) Transcript_34812:115-525(-)
MRNGKRHAKAIFILSVHFYPRLFKMDQYGSIFGLNRYSHNIEVGMDVLVKAKIMEASNNVLNEKVYGIVARINRHIDYRDQDEYKIERQLNRLIADGNKKASNKSDIKINRNNGKKKRKRVNQQNASNTNSVHSVH